MDQTCARRAAGRSVYFQVAWLTGLMNGDRSSLLLLHLAVLVAVGFLAAPQAAADSAGKTCISQGCPKAMNADKTDIYVRKKYKIKQIASIIRLCEPEPEFPHSCHGPMICVLSVREGTAVRSWHKMRGVQGMSSKTWDMGMILLHESETVSLVSCALCSDMRWRFAA